MDDAIWDVTVFTKNRERLLDGDIAEAFFQAVLQARERNLLSDEHFTVDGTLLEAWAGVNSYQRKDAKNAVPPDDPGNATVDFHEQKRSNQTQASKTDPDAKMARKGKGKEAKLSYSGNLLVENCHGLIVNTEVFEANGTAERDAAPVMLEQIPGTKQVTVGGDKASRSNLACSRWYNAPARTVLQTACTGWVLETTTGLNAYVIGIGASKRMVVFDITIAKLTNRQIVYAAGHGTGHYVLQHNPKGLAFFVGLLLLFFYVVHHLIGWVLARWGASWGVRGLDDWASLPVLLFLLSLLFFVATPVVSAFSRYLEHQSDQFSLEVTHGLTPDSAQVATQAFQVLGE